MEKRNVPKLRFKGFEDEWREKKIKDISIKVGSGKTPKGGNAVYKSKGIPFIRSQNVLNGYLSVEDIVFISEIENENMKSTKIRPNDILLNITGASIGRCCVIPSDFKNGNLNQHVCIIRLDENNSKFLMNYIISDKIQKQIYSYQAGGNREGLNFEQIKGMKIGIPSLEEQTKIANFLSNVDNIIEEQEGKVKDLEQYKKGMMQKIFKQEVRFKDENGGEYPEWEENKIKDIFSIIAGGDIKKENVSESKTEKFKYPIYANSLVDKGLYGYSDIYKVEEETITVTGRGNLGVANARYTKYYPIVRLLVLKPIKACNIKFFEEIINNTKILIESTGVPQLTGPQLSNIKVKYPCIEEQIKIANFLSNIDNIIEEEKKKLEDLKLWKKGLLQQMFV